MTKSIIIAFLRSTCSIFFVFCTGIYATAQVTIDGTTSTIVTSPDNNNFTINDGDRAGTNLFHSFQDFSVPTNGSASFNNAADIVNIFSRVTGGNISNIDGLIRANDSANLFLINPTGIIFGANARLDIGGSFLGSTADSLLFLEGEFSATNLDSPPVITINAPIGLGFRDNPGDIVNQSIAHNGSNLAVSTGKNITLVGGDINLAGGQIYAPGGRVELGGLAATGTIDINADGSLSFPDTIKRANVTLTNQATVDVRAGGGGFIHVNARNVTLVEQSKIFAGIAENMGSSDAQAGDISLDATESVKLIGVGFNELIEVTGIIISGRLSTSNLQDSTGIISATEDTGQSGNILIKTPDLFLQNGSILVNTILNSSKNNISETSGNIVVSDSQQVEIDSSFLSTLANRNTERDAGDITINTERLSVKRGGAIASSTFGNGNGGDINIYASEFIEVTTTLIDTIAPTAISSGSIFGQGEAGDINIDTRKLIIREGGTISSSSGGIIFIGENQNSRNILEPSDFQIDPNGNVILIKGGLGGNLRIKADFIEITGRSLENGLPSAVSSNSTTPAKAGNINIDANRLIISDGAEIEVGSILTGEGGNINIQANSLSLTNETSISAQANGTADGGNINIEAKFIIASPQQNNDIIARAEQGTGGNIQITAEGVFGLQERSSNPTNNTNDIDASSKFGLDGTVLINTPDVGTFQEVIEAPEISQLQTLGKNACSGEGITEVSRFNIIGKGGVPPQPTEPLSSNTVFIQGGSSPLGRRQQEKLKPLVTTRGEIYPARGIVFLENGDIVLTAYPTDSIQRIPSSSPNCRKS